MLPLLAAVATAAPLDPSGFVELAPTFAPGAAVVIDTTGPSPTLSVGGAVAHTGVMSGYTAVFTFGSATVGQPVSVSGPNPVALLTTGDLTVTDTIDASASGQTPGPGGHPGGACSGGGGFGGGQGGSWGAGGGGFGGQGGDNDSGMQGGQAYGDLLVTLEGGSGGGGGRYSSCPNPPGGGGGGAVELGAGGVLTLSGTVLADGGDGAPNGSPNTGDGGGGGAGGGILLHARGGSCTGVLSAIGGDGGSGGGSSYPDGGGGGGGRIVVTGLSTAGCTTQVAGGDGPWTGSDGARDGSPGTVDLLDPDSDADGFSVTAGGDCDDADPGVSPGALEIPCTTVDEDCDAGTPDDPDDDGDGASLCAGADCDDTDPAISPLLGESVCNAIDDDCDPGTPDVPSKVEVPCNGVDDDCDPATPDCEVEDTPTGTSGETGATGATGATGMTGDTGATGDPVRRTLDGRTTGSGCGCAVGGPRAGWVAWLALLAIALRGSGSRASACRTRPRS